MTSGVGKTSLLKSFMGINPGLVSSPTIGVDFYKKIIENKDAGRLRVQFWDTAGQEKYRSMSVLHTRG